jgi:hypothetical protein
MRGDRRLRGWAPSGHPDCAAECPLSGGLNRSTQHFILEGSMQPPNLESMPESPRQPGCSIRPTAEFVGSRLRDFSHELRTRFDRSRTHLSVRRHRRHHLPQPRRPEAVCHGRRNYAYAYNSYNSKRLPPASIAGQFVVQLVASGPFNGKSRQKTRLDELLQYFNYVLPLDR